MLPATRRWSASHFAQLVIIACLLSISLLNATPLPTAVPSLGLSDQSSYLHSQFSKRMEVVAASNAAKTVAQSTHELSEAHTAATALEATSETKGLPSTSAAINSAVDSKTRSILLPAHLDHTQNPTLDDLLFHDALPEFRTTQPAAPSDSSLSQAKSAPSGPPKTDPKVDFTPTAQAEKSSDHVQLTEPPLNEGHSQPSHPIEPHTPDKHSTSIHYDTAEVAREIPTPSKLQWTGTPDEKWDKLLTATKPFWARTHPPSTPPVMKAGQSSVAHTREPRPPPVDSQVVPGVTFQEPVVPPHDPPVGTHEPSQVPHSSETRVPTANSESETSHSVEPSHPTVNKPADELPPKKSSKLSNFSRFFTKDYWKSFPKTSWKFSNFSRFFTKDYWKSFFSWKKSLLYRKLPRFKKVRQNRPTTPSQ